MAGPQAGSKSFQCRTFVLLNSRIANFVFCRRLDLTLVVSRTSFPFFLLVPVPISPSSKAHRMSNQLFLVLGSLSLDLSPFRGIWERPSTSLLQKIRVLGKRPSSTILTGLASCGSVVLTTSASFCHNHQLSHIPEG